MRPFLIKRIALCTKGNCFPWALATLRDHPHQRKACASGPRLCCLGVLFSPSDGQLSMQMPLLSPSAHCTLERGTWVAFFSFPVCVITVSSSPSSLEPQGCLSVTEASEHWTHHLFQFWFGATGFSGSEIGKTGNITHRTWVFHLTTGVLHILCLLPLSVPVLDWLGAILCWAKGRSG